MSTLAKTNDVFKIVNMSELSISPFNARKQDEESPTSEMFQWLCQSIKIEGLLEPLVVRPVGPHKYEIIAGTRRFAALKHIGATTAAVVIKEMEDNDVRIASLVENVHRLDLTDDEKEYTLRQIYITSWNYWKPNKYPVKIRGKVKETMTTKPYYQEDFDNDNLKILLAKTYLQRIHNESNQTVNFSKVKQSEYLNTQAKRNDTQEVFPTKEFIYLSSRVGYSASWQINILRGYGSYSLHKDYLEELSPTIRELVEAAAKERALKEAEKQALAKVALASSRKIKHDNKQPKTKKQKIKRTIKTFVNKLERQKLAEQHRIQQIKERLQKQQSAYLAGQKPQEPTIQINPVRARQDISALGHRLFQLLTSQELQTAQSNINEALIKNPLAVETMKQLTTFFAGYSDIAAQQMVVIPLCIALERYRGMLYEAVEAQRRKEEMSGQ